MTAHPADSAEALRNAARAVIDSATLLDADHTTVATDKYVALAEAIAALQASDSRVDQAERLAPSPAADIHDLPGHKAHECRICGQWTERAAAEGSEPLDVERLARVIAATTPDEWADALSDTTRLWDFTRNIAAAYASQTSTPVGAEASEGQE